MKNLPKVSMSNLKNKPNLVLAIVSGVVWIILDVAAIWIVSFAITKRLEQSTQNSNKMENNLKNEAIQIQHAFNTTEMNEYPLVDFYIAGSYNSCSAGQLQDDWVSLEPLKIILKRGIRAVDFEIYMLPNGVPCVAVGNNPIINSKIKCQNTITTTKGSYDYVSIPEVFNCINSYGFNNSPTQNDPIFINLRIRTKNADVFGILEKNITNAFRGKLLGPKYGKGGKLLKRPDQFLHNKPLKDFKGKVIIMVEDYCGNYKNNNGFWELVNLEATPGNLRIFTEKDIRNADMLQLIKENKNTLALTKPDDTMPISNSKSNVHRKYGCQIILMNYSHYDDRLKEHMKYFREKGTSIVLKPKPLRKVRMFAKLPNKRNEDIEGLNKKQARVDPVTGKTYTY